VADRYALYFAPAPDTALARFGSRILAHDAATGADLQALVPDGFDAAKFHVLTEEPRRYGFHATLKAPFRLREGRSEAELAIGLRDFAARQTAFTLPRLAVTAIRSGSAGGFVALTEPQPTPALLALERTVVPAFEAFRAPLTEAEIARRRPETLGERQRANLLAYGYPHVLEDFRFHMTLTGRVPEPDLDRMVDALAVLYARHVADSEVAVDALSLFRQRPGERFRILARAAFGSRDASVPRR